MSEKRAISFHFHPFDFDKQQHAIEKTENGVKRRYLRGISSGILKDGQGERMTLDCIKSMMEQGNSGNVLLFSGLHGVNFIDDLGILSESEIVDKTNWLTTYRIYDQYDKMPADTIGKADKLWKQVNGLPPYKKPIQKGFSIEGFVPENEILDKKIEDDGRWSQRVINDMVLEGTVVVSRPAYQDSVVTAVYKCLKELSPIASETIHKNIRGELVQKINENQESRNFYQKYFEVNAVFEDKIYEIMKVNDGRSEHRLNILFDEYKYVMKDIILNHTDVFESVAKVDTIEDNTGKVQLLMKQLANTARLFTRSINKRIGG